MSTVFSLRVLRSSWLLTASTLTTSSMLVLAIDKVTLMSGRTSRSNTKLMPVVRDSASKTAFRLASRKSSVTGLRSAAPSTGAGGAVAVGAAAAAARRSCSRCASCRLSRAPRTRGWLGAISSARLSCDSASSRRPAARAASACSTSAVTWFSRWRISCMRSSALPGSARTAFSSSARPSSVRPWSSRAWPLRACSLGPAQAPSSITKASADSRRRLIAGLRGARRQAGSMASRSGSSGSRSSARRARRRPRCHRREAVARVRPW